MVHYSSGCHPSEGQPLAVTTPLYRQICKKQHQRGHSGQPQRRPARAAARSCRCSLRPIRILAGYTGKPRLTAGSDLGALTTSSIRWNLDKTAEFHLPDQ